jgi:hypothetical protein
MAFAVQQHRQQAGGVDRDQVAIEDEVSAAQVGLEHATDVARLHGCFGSPATVVKPWKDNSGQ